jgi:hypothetical protein
LRGPHPFFWLVVVSLIPSAVAACAADRRAPGYAVNSLWVYRLEVALAFFVGVYVLIVVLWLASQGRSVRQAQLPGGGGVDLPDPNLDRAAEGFDEFQRETQARLETHEDSLDELDDRVTQLESRRD